MNIGFDAKRLFNNFTGLGNYSRTTLDILTEFYPENNYWLYTPRIIKNDITRPYTLLPNCRTIRPHGHMPHGLWRTFLQTRDLSRNMTDVFHGLSHEIPMGLGRKGIPAVVTMHDVAFKTFKDMYHWHDRQIYDIKFHYACKHANHIVAISEATKADVIRFYGVDESKISVIYQPVQRLFYSAPGREEARKLLSDAGFAVPDDFILYVGTINSRKNLLSLVRAYETLPADLRIPVVVIGNGREYKHKVQEYIAKKGLGESFIWQKVGDNRLLQAFYTCARVFVYPSFYEGFGLPVVEAMLSGCPVVTSNVSSLPEAGGDAALYASPGDVGEIAFQIRSVLEDEELRKRMTESGKAYANRMFAPESIAEDLMDVYNKVVNG